MVYGASWLPQFLSLLILTNLDKSSHLCWASFPPRAQAMFVSLRCRVHPIQLTLLRCLHISSLSIFPCPPYKYTTSPAVLGSTQDLGSKRLQLLRTHSSEISLMNACQSKGSQENSLQASLSVEAASPTAH